MDLFKEEARYMTDQERKSLHKFYEVVLAGFNTKE